MDGPRLMPAKDVEYPERDGRPMGETDDHRDEMKDYVINVLKDHFRDDPMTYVSGNNFVYYTEGTPTDSVSPDTYVVKGVPKRQRNIYKVWEEGGRIPSFVLEITSKKTWMEDLGDKMARYRDAIGVSEYFMFDLRGEWIEGHLRGYQLRDGVYQPLVLNPSGRLTSCELGLELGIEDGHLRFYRPGAAEPLPTREERIEHESARAKSAEDRAAHAEDRVARAEDQAERERRRAERAEEEARRLSTELARLRGSAPPPMEP